ncbi:MAG: tetratricopeptide repeat protein [Pirellulales bacterium]
MHDSTSTTARLENTRRLRLVAALLLVGAVWAVYWQSLHSPFVCDDTSTVVENQSLRRLWPLVGDGEVRGPLSPAKDLPTSGRPLVNFSFAVNYHLGELSTWGYHVFNVALHTLNVLLLAALVRRGLQLPRFYGKFTDAAGPIAFAVALLWAVHPLNTDAVVYLTQRTELMVGLFYLATMYGGLRFLADRRPAWGFAAVVACWAGMASKEVMATAPVMVLLLDRTFIAPTLREAWQKSRAFYVGLFASWLLLVCLAGPGPRSASAGFGLGVAATDWWLTQSQVLLMYLRLAVWPWPLSVHHEPPYLTSLGAAWMYVVPVAVLVTGALVLLWRRSAAGYLLSFALAILAPTLVVPIVTEIAAERRMYLPLAALLTLLVAGGYAGLRRFMPARTAATAVVAVSLLLAFIGGVVSATRLKAFNDELVLWQDVIQHDPNNATAHYNVGTTLLERGSPQAAADHFRRAIELRPDYARAYHNLGSALGALGRRDEATKAFQRAVELEPRYSLAHVKLGLTALKAGATDEARKHFETALQVAPYDAEANAAMAELMLNSGELADAVRYGRAAVESAPNNSNAHATLGAALARQQMYTEAIEQFEAAVDLDPDSLQAMANLMAAYSAAGRSQEAQTTAQRALELARAQGDAAMVERIQAFLAATPTGAAPQESPDAASR